MKLVVILLMALGLWLTITGFMGIINHDYSLSDAENQYRKERGASDELDCRRSTDIAEMHKAAGNTDKYETWHLASKIDCRRMRENVGLN